MARKLNNTALEKSWAALLEGAEAGIAGLYDLLWEKLFAYATRILRDQDAAADVIQDLFIHLWEKRATLPVAADVEAYVFRALKHAVLNHLQSAGLRDKHLEAFEKVTAKFDSGMLDALYQKELLLQIKASSEVLPLRMKEIFVMNKFENKSVSEISRELNLSEQTVRNQINLALKKIKPFIAEDSLIYLAIFLHYLP